MLLIVKMVRQIGFYVYHRSYQVSTMVPRNSVFCFCMLQVGDDTAHTGSEGIGQYVPPQLRTLVSDILVWAQRVQRLFLPAPRRTYTQ